MDTTTDNEDYQAALSDDPVETTAETTTEQVAVEPDGKTEDGPARDEQGRFAPKEEKPEPVATETKTTETAKEQPEANVPSWRLREEREAREAAERRFNDAQSAWQRQFATLQSQLPKPEPQKRPDLYENPDGFVEYGVRQAVEPIKSEMDQVREFYSRRDAVRDFGEEKVRNAFVALDQAAKAGDPEARATVARVKSSMHPFGDMVTWHQRQSVFQTIGSDPNAWFEKELETRMSKPEFQAQLMTKVQQSVRGGDKGNQVRTQVRLPPSLSRVGSAGNADAEEDSDMSDEALYRSALR